MSYRAKLLPDLQPGDVVLLCVPEGAEVTFPPGWEGGFREVTAEDLEDQ